MILLDTYAISAFKQVGGNMQRHLTSKKRFPLSIIAASCFMSFQAHAAMDCSNISTWSATAEYLGGAQVQKSNTVYAANWWTKNESPDNHSAPGMPWSKVDVCLGNEEGSIPSIPEPETPKPEVPKPDLGDVIPFVPGTTVVKNGDTVSFNGQCFIAKNNPGLWESPSADSWFWELTDCSGEPDPEPEVPEVTELSILSPTAGQTLKVGEAVAIKANVDGDLAAKLEFWADGVKIATKQINQSQTLYSQKWTPSEAGNAEISLFVYDKNNQKIKEQSITVTVTEEATEDFTPPQVNFVAPTNGATVKQGETLTITLNASDLDDDLAGLVVKANNQQICDFDLANTKEFSCDWLAEKAGSVTLTAVATDAQSLTTSASVTITVKEEAVEPPVTEPDGLCEEFNVYPNWTQGNHATGGDIMVYDNIAYSAIYWTNSVPGSDASWALHLNCDGSEPGTAPLLSLPNPMDPVRLEVAGWPNTFVVASPSSSKPATLTLKATDSDSITDLDKLTQAFVLAINTASSAGTSSVIIDTDMLDKATQDKSQLSKTIAVKEALLKAIDATGSRLDIKQVNALSDDLKGWTQAHHLILSELAPKATYGWTLAIGDFAYDTHSGRQSVWDKASQGSADLLAKLDLYNPENTTKADFVAFNKSSETPALTADQWHNALEFVKQVTDYVATPAMLAKMPTAQTANYFMGQTTNERQIRKAAHSNVFALLFDENSAELNAKIKHYQTAKVPLYYVGKELEKGALTSIDALNKALANAENAMDNEAFLYETPQSEWIPSTVYKWNDFLDGLNAMHNIGVAGNKFWLLDEKLDDETNIKYAKVAIAAFLAQSMQETIRYNACDENNWSETRYGAPTDYPMSASCGQLGQKYADYGVNPTSGLDYAYSCPRDNKMEVSALTHAKWYGAPAPVFAAPDAVLEERGLLVNGYAGRWTNEGHCNDVPEKVDTSKQVWERNDCQIYVGQKAGTFIWDGSSQESVEGCGWWGRGVIQTTGRQNFGTLNHYLGRSHVNPDNIGKTIDGVKVEAPPANPLYSDLDFCSNPGLICSSEENKEIKWIAGLFYWVTSVQAYANEGGPYSDWNYYSELKNYVDSGLKGTQFIDDVSGIVNRGCPDTVCSTGEVHNVKERQANFKLVLEKLGLTPQ